MKPPLELLSPAGDLASLRAAIHNGADAVYLGARQFGARAAKGFDDTALAEAIHYAHLYGKRVYVTVNTLVKQAEFPELISLLHTLDTIKADALIVQDLGMIRYARTHLPHLPLHASTQMSIHNASGSAWLKRLGLTRVVAARECSLPTLRLMAATGLETEVFIHGALCVSQSGQCLLSSMIGGRSGNRGRCAQPCRMQYTIDGRQAAWLSPRDIMLVDRLRDLVDAGVTSLKIEGRLKRPEYVAVVTDIYRRVIDHVYDTSRPPAPTEADRQALLQVFNRGGFSEGYLDGPDDQAIINPDRVSHEGVRLGCLLSTQRLKDIFVSHVLLERDLHNGDHLQIRSAIDQEMIYAGPPVAAGQEAMIRHHQWADANSDVYRLTDALQMIAAAQTIAAPQSGINADMAMDVSPGEGSRLTLCARGTSVTIQGAVAKPAQSRALDRETALRAMTKTGDSPFELRSFQFVSSAPSFLPVSAMNALRREGLGVLEKALVQAHQRQQAPVTALPDLTPVRSPDVERRLWVRTSGLDSLRKFADAGAHKVAFLPLSYDNTALERDIAQVAKAGSVLCLPGQCEDDVLENILRITSRYSVDVLLDNVGQLQSAWMANTAAGSGIPAWNGESLQLLADLGIQSVVLSRELGKDDVSALNMDKPAGLELVLPVYGRARVMTLNHCPRRLSADRTAATACAVCQSSVKQQADMTDQFGYSFPLQPLHMPGFCVNYLLFHTALHMGKRAPNMSWMLDFTTEDESRALEITRWYRARIEGLAPPPLDIPENLGRWTEGVL